VANAAPADLMARVETYFRGLVAAGFESPDGILQRATQNFEDEPGFERMTEHTRRLLRAAIREHLDAQSRWRDETDCDRLDRAFAVLERSGIVSRQNFSCCTNCGVAEIHDEMEEARRVGVYGRGYVLYHEQDTESAVAGGGICLAYGDADHSVIRSGSDAVHRRA
jgi:hypothetical protein